MLKEETLLQMAFLMMPMFRLNRIHLRFLLKKGGLELLLTQGVDQDIENTFLDMFGMSVKVEMIETESYDVEKGG